MLSFLTAGDGLWDGFRAWALFAGIIALGQFSPGPDMILLTRVSLRAGRKAGWLVVLGIVSGLCLHAALAISGMSALMVRGGFWKMGLSLVAVAYLAWLGWQMISSFVSAQVEPLKAEASEGEEENWYLKGLLCNLLNPKVVVFFAGITALFLKEEKGGGWPLLLWGTIVLEGLVLWGLWVVLLQRRAIRDFYHRNGKWLDLSFGIGLWLLAAMLLGHAFWH